MKQVQQSSRFRGKISRTRKVFVPHLLICMWPRLVLFGVVFRVREKMSRSSSVAWYAEGIVSFHYLMREVLLRSKKRAKVRSASSLHCGNCQHRILHIPTVVVVGSSSMGLISVTTVDFSLFSDLSRRRSPPRTHGTMCSFRPVA